MAADQASVLRAVWHSSVVTPKASAPPPLPRIRVVHCKGRRSIDETDSTWSMSVTGRKLVARKRKQAKTGLQGANVRHW